MIYIQIIVSLVFGGALYYLYSKIKLLKKELIYSEYNFKVLTQSYNDLQKQYKDQNAIAQKFSEKKSQHVDGKLSFIELPDVQNTSESKNIRTTKVQSSFVKKNKS